MNPARFCSFAAVSYRFSRDPAMTFRKRTVKMWNGILNALLWILNLCNESEPRESKPYLWSNFISLSVVKRAVSPASLEADHLSTLSNSYIEYGNRWCKWSKSSKNTQKKKKVKPRSCFVIENFTISFKGSTYTVSLNHNKGKYEK